MPSVARCPFCAVKMNLPEKAIGASVKCPRCANPFTAVPFDPDEPALSDAAPALPAQTTTSATNTSGPTAVVEGVQATGTRKRLLHPCGALAWFCAGFALLFASLPGFTFLTIPLCIVALAFGFLGMFAIEYKPAQVTCIVGGFAGLVVLGVATLTPTWLGTVWATSNRHVTKDAHARYLVSNDGKKETKMDDPAAWVDSRDGGIKQGPILVQITKCAWCPPTVKPPAQAPATKVLHICVRIRNTGPANNIDYDGLGFASGSSLKDHLGKAQPSYEFPKGIESIGRIERAVIAPGAFVDDTLLFTNRGDELHESYQLELPGTAWAQKGVFRFTIQKGEIEDGPLYKGNAAPAPAPGFTGPPKK